MNTKKVLLDTNVLMDSPEILDAFKKVVLPIQVIEEIDGLKKSDGERGFKAREASRKIEANKDKIEFLIKDVYYNIPTDWDLNKNDNKIVLAARDNNCTLLSNDLNVLIKAKSLGVECESYNDKKITDTYKGYKEVVLNDIEMASFYSSMDNGWELFENEYLIIKNTEGKIVDRLKWTEDGFKNLDYKPMSSKALGKIKPRNIQQELLFDMLQDKKSTIKVCTGRFGSGKDFSMIAHAINLLENEKFKKIVWVRNNIEVKNSKEIGFLPGSANEKLLPYAMPIADHLGGEFGLKMMIEAGKIELQHLGFIRGRDIKDAIIYCSEAENMTKEHIQLLIGRCGENTILYLNGDFKQVDDKVFEQNNGLNILTEKLKGNKNFGFVRLEKTERSETAALADLLD